MNIHKKVAGSPAMVASKAHGENSWTSQCCKLSVCITIDCQKLTILVYFRFSAAKIHNNFITTKDFSDILTH